MDSKQRGSEDLASPGIQAFKDWSSKPVREMPAGSVPTGRVEKDDIIIAAQPREGETVLFFGSCGDTGPSALAKAVGAPGQVIGVIPKKSSSDASREVQECNIPNVRCIESSMVTIDTRDGVADCVMSSLLGAHVPGRDIQAIHEELFRVTRPGGRIVITDVMIRKEIPDSIRNIVPASCNILKTGIQSSMYESYLKNAGFETITIKDSGKDVNPCVIEQIGECASSTTPTQPGKHQPDASDAYESQGARKEEDKSGGSYRRKVGKFTRQLVTGENEREEKTAEETDWNEYAGIFMVIARKPQ